MMKKLTMILMLLAVFTTACQKDYDLEPTQKPSAKPELKVSGASMTADTAQTLPNTYIVYVWSGLPLSASSYAYTWDLGNGTSSTLPNPQVKYSVGLYHVTSTATPIAGGTAYTDDIWVRAGTIVLGDAANILISAYASGNSWVYELGMNTSYIANYAFMSGNTRFVSGSFTSWDPQPANTVQVINGIEYMKYTVTVPNSDALNKRFWGYGRESTWAWAPNDQLWISTDDGGYFGAYFYYGQILPYIGEVSGIPGDIGDLQVADTVPTVRMEILYGSSDPDSLRVFINHVAYANGPQPFISRKTSINTWENEPLIMSSDYLGWSYFTYAIGEVTDLLQFKFGPHLLSTNLFGVMNNSMYYSEVEGLLAVQILGIENRKYFSIKAASLSQQIN
ncbi:MAG: PKD domain-containing protein [bacterium]|nr:PKD domain-containing protein [bacterium]